jgi:tRNA modification GTPase
MEAEIQQDETIAAISTPMGEGGIGVVRLSGRTAVRILIDVFRGPSGKQREKFESHKVNYGFIVDEAGEKIDEVLATVMNSPLSFTREDIVEISCHGGNAVLKMVLRRVLKSGARMAEPGEFSKRAFLNGRIDLVQAEAIIDLIRTKSERGWNTAFSQLDGRLSHALHQLEDGFVDLIAKIEVSIDFPEEEQEVISNEAICAKMQELKDKVTIISKSYVVGRVYREGIGVAIAGKPNVGKSSLMNALLQRERAIVTEHPGTTRDVIEETLHVDGVAIRIIDTAGVRDATDTAESEGIKRAIQAVKDSDIAIILFDGSEPLEADDVRMVEKILSSNATRKCLIPVVNKADLEEKADLDSVRKLVGKEPVKISAKRGDGVDLLLTRINSEIDLMGDPFSEGPVLTRERHFSKFKEMEVSLTNAISAISEGRSREFAIADLQDGKEALEELTGKVVDDSVIEKIFSEFCIGK